HARLVEAEIACVGDAADGEQDMRADDGAVAIVAIDADRHALLVWRKRDAFGLQAEGDAFLLEDGLDGVRNLGILAADQTRSLLDDGDLAAEAAEHLREFQPDIAAADNDEMFGQEIDLHHG